MAKVTPAKAATASTGNAVATQDKTTTALVEAPDSLLAGLLEDAGAGLEQATASDFALSFVHLLQKMSPQVDKADGSYIQGAEAGMFMNSVTKELYNELRVIPVDFVKVFIEWIPRDAGGGFVAQYKTRQDADANVQEGHQIVDTANHFVLLWSERDEQWNPAIISMTSTKLKASRNWVSKMSMVTLPKPGGGRVTAPTYARYYSLLPEAAKNEHGSFYTIAVNLVEGEDGWVKDPELHVQAKNFRASLAAGTKGADFSKAAETLVEEEGNGANPKF